MILDGFIGLFSKDLGIDLGTANTLVAAVGEGIIVSEPSVVAVKRGTNEVLLGGMAVGDLAKKMIDMAPPGIMPIRPMKDGVIADFEITRAMLRYFIRRAHKRRALVKPRLVIGVPYGITTVEERAVCECALSAGAREVFLVEEPMAGAIGAGAPVTEPQATMVVDVGGGTSEVAVISLAGIVTATSLRVAGDEFNAAIISYLKRTHNLNIGLRSAEYVKHAIGSAWTLEQELSLEVRGQNDLTKRPDRSVITSEEIREALHEPLESIINAIRMTLERTPPELSADLLDCGIILIGGGALLRNLDQRISEATGLPVRVADDPLTCVARGTGATLEQLNVLKPVLRSARDVA